MIFCAWIEDSDTDALPIREVFLWAGAPAEMKEGLEQHEIFFQPFDVRGHPLAAPQQVRRTLTASLIPSIRPAGSGFALAWNETVLVPAGHDAPSRSEIAFTEVP